MADGEAVYPAQLLTDLVNGEIVGLTAVYDKSVSTSEISAVFNTLYGKWQLPSRGDNSDAKLWLWRVEQDQLVIQLVDRDDGSKQVIYLKLGATSSLAPAAHVDGDNPCH